MTRLSLFALCFTLLLLACRPVTPRESNATATPRVFVDRAMALANTAVQNSNPSITATTTVQPPPTPPLATSPATPIASPTATVSPKSSSTPTIVPSPTSIPPCELRQPSDDLFTIVTQTYGLGEAYEPEDIVPLNDHFPFDVTLGYPLRLRKVAVKPLIEMVDAMKEAGLQPQIVSGYRDHYEQFLAYQKWSIQFPNRVDAISAQPGHSEHQLGTTVDFTSPELPALTGDPSLQFHTYFSQTSEGIWLAENAHRFGFTLSYPPDAFESTGFHYEPWHFRYVGVARATRLNQLGISFTEFQLLNEPPPCLPTEE